MHNRMAIDYSALHYNGGIQMKKQSQKIQKLAGEIPFKKRFLSILFIVFLFQMSSNQIWSRIPFAQESMGRDFDETQFVQDYILEINPKISPTELEILTESTIHLSKKLEFSIPTRSLHLNKTDFLMALIQTESGFHKKARSHKNAQGYMQLMPATAEWMYNKSGRQWSSDKITETNTNLEIGIEYLNYLMDKMGSLEKAALAYNAGPTAVRKWGGVSTYWSSILDNYKEIQRFKKDRVRR